MYFMLEFKSFYKKEASSLSLYLRLQILHQWLGVAGIPDLDGQDPGRMRNLRRSEGGLGEGLHSVQKRNFVLSISCKNSEQILSLEKYCKGGSDI